MVSSRRRDLDVLTMGRIGVDIYPLQYGVGLEDVTSFGKFLGGSPTNVAVAAARLRHSAAVVTAVGDDPFGRFCRREMARLGVYDNYVLVNSELPTPVTFCEIFPPDDFPLYFYRRPTAPDLRITPDDVPEDAVRNAQILWLSVTGLCQQPSYDAHCRALEVRGKAEHTVLDLDYRSMFWQSAAKAHEAVSAVLPHVTVAIGNREECEMAVGESDPDRAAHALLDAGVQLAVVKQGPKGTLAMTREERVEVAPTPIDVTNGLGAGDSFGGSLCHGLLEGWSLAETIQAASAAGALVATRLECSTAMPSEPELFAMMAKHPDIANQRGASVMTRTPLIDKLLDRRLADPVRFADRVRQRPRATWSPTEPLMVVAADHPARGALAAGGRADAMADREHLLERCVTALGRPGVNGFLGTADMVADLANLDALDGKVVFGSMNRGGFAGASFELDDRMTGYDVQGILDEDLTGGKMLLRFDLSDPGTATTAQACAEAVTTLARARRIAMVEPFISYRADDGKVVNDLSADAVVKSVVMASGLGADTSWTWLKLPAVDDMERVVRATSLPILLLGGEVSTDPEETRRRWATALAARHVRGLVLGRSVLYPPDSDVATAIDNAVQLLGVQA